MPTKRARPPSPKKGVYKAYTPFSPTELEQIDNWGFAARMRTRSDVVRALVMKALSEPVRRSA